LALTADKLGSWIPPARAEMRNQAQQLSCDSFRKSVEKIHRYYQGLIEFCVSQKDQEGAEILIKEFQARMAECYKLLAEEKKNAKGNKHKQRQAQKKMDVVRGLVARGFADYSCPTTFSNPTAGEIRAHCGWVADFQVVAMTKDEVSARITEMIYSQEELNELFFNLDVNRGQGMTGGATKEQAGSYMEQLFPGAQEKIEKEPEE